MNESSGSALQGRIVEDEVHFTLVELCRACDVSEVEVRGWVVEGVIEPSGEQPQEWRFAGSALGRSRLAAHLAHDLDLNTPGVALALDLLDEIATLRAQLLRRGG